MSTYYREVRRKAAVGERIKVVSPTIAYGYDVGDEGTVSRTYPSGVFASINDRERAMYHDEYVVLEPVEEPSVFPQDFVNFVLENADGIRKLIDQIEKEAA